MFLVAVPQLGDPNFKKSVVLLLHQSSKGAIGLIINNPTDINLKTFSRQQGLPCHSDLEREPVFFGGPVEPGRGWIIHANEAVAEKQEILEGIFLSGSKETLRNLLEQGKGPTHLLLGYAGWGPGQLKRELTGGSWLMTEAKAKHILHTNPDEVWDAVLTDMGVDPDRIAIGGGVH